MASENESLRILIVEDDLELAQSMVVKFRAHGYDAERTADGRTGLNLALNNSYRAIVLDRMLPMLDGLGVVRELRACSIATPVIYLTTMSGIDDRVHGLEAGGDDYLVKPFAFEELLARVRALTRRSAIGQQPATRLRAGALQMDLLARSVHREGKAIDLLPQEFRLLEYLIRNANRVVTRTMLLENVWDIHFDPHTSVVESHISRLRAKINLPGGPDMIQTIRGTGYKLLAN